MICIQDESVLKEPITTKKYTVPFGTLLKVTEIQEGQCHVFNSYMSGWIDCEKVMSLSDPDLLSTIQKVNLPQAVKEYALGNYFIRRNLITAREHFTTAVQLDPNLDHGYVDKLFLHQMLGEKEEMQNALMQLKRFPQWEAVVLSFAIRNNAEEKTFRRCDELIQNGDSSFLAYALAAHLYNQQAAQLIPNAHKLAVTAYEAQPFNPVRAYLVASICEFALKNIEDEQIKQRSYDSAVAFCAMAAKHDHNYWKSYENMAFLLKSKGEHGEAIRLAQAALRMNPRAVNTVELLASYENAVATQQIEDATGTAVVPEELLGMSMVTRALKQTQKYDLPQMGSTWFEEYLRLHGYTLVPAGFEIIEGSTALHDLVTDRNVIGIRYLSQHYNLNWNVQNNQGKNPLHIAIEEKDIPLVDILIRTGADVNSKAKDGSSAMTIAVQQEYAPLLYRMTWSDNLSPETITDLRRHLNASDDVRREELREQVSHMVEDFFSDALRNVKTRLDDYKQTLASLNSTQKKPQPQGDYYPRSRLPFFVPSEIADDAERYPTRARTRYFRRMQEEIDQEIKLNELNKIATQIDAMDLKENAEEMRGMLLRGADAIMIIAFHSYPYSEFEAFQKTTGLRLEEMLAKKSIEWQMPYSSKAK